MNNIQGIADSQKVTSVIQNKNIKFTKNTHFLLSVEFYNFLILNLQAAG